jgi:hypothetical protein
MDHKIDIEIRAYCPEFDCHIAYSLNDCDRNKPEMIVEIIKVMEEQLNRRIKIKNEKMNKEANLTNC